MTPSRPSAARRLVRLQRGVVAAVVALLALVGVLYAKSEAIVLGDNYELSFTDRRQAIYGKDMLLEPVASESMLTPRKVEAGVYTRSVPEMKDSTD